MSIERPIDELLGDWMAGGPTEVPDRVLVDALGTIERTPQDSGLRRPWRTYRVTETARILIAASLVVALVVGGSIAGRFASQPIGAGPDPTPTADASSSPIPAPSTSTFRSDLFRYSVDYPGHWRVSDPLGEVVTFRGPLDGPYFEVYVVPASRGLYWSTVRPIIGTNLDEVTTAALAWADAAGYTVVFDERVTVGGQPAQRIELASADIADGPRPATIVFTHRAAVLPAGEPDRDLIQAIVSYGPLKAPEIDIFLRGIRFEGGVP